MRVTGGHYRVILTYRRRSSPRITEFQTKVEITYIKEGNERSASGDDLRHLLALSDLT